MIYRRGLSIGTYKLEQRLYKSHTRRRDAAVMMIILLRIRIFIIYVLFSLFYIVRRVSASEISSQTTIVTTVIAILSEPKYKKNSYHWAKT